jgi:hypothetical protein
MEPGRYGGEYYEVLALVKTKLEKRLSEVPRASLTVLKTQSIYCGSRFSIYGISE